jgi:hypothetical protein
VTGVLALLVLLRNPERWRHWLAGMAVWLLGLSLTVWPLIGYALRHPETFNDRVGDVALLSEESLHGRAPLAVLDEALGRHMLMFNVRGDSNGRHHAPERPMLDFVTGIGFLVGCGLLLRRWYDWRSLFLVAALAIRVAPGLLAVNGPHAMRSIGVVAFACIIAASGWIAVLKWLSQRAAERGGRLAFLRLPPLAAAVVGLALLFNVWTYFLYMPSEPRVWTSFYPVHTKAGAYVRALAREQHTDDLRHVYVARKLVRNDVFRYLTHGLTVETFEGASFSAPVQPGELLVFSGYTYQQDLEAVTPHLDLALEPVTYGVNLPGRTQPSFVVYEARKRGDEG